jgi:hypothetical protein
MAVGVRPARVLAAGSAVALSVLAAGCGSTAAGPAATTTRPVSLPLGSSIASAGTTWALLPMGVSRGHNLFWQVFALAKGGSRWALATPIDAATNGALALAVTGDTSVTAAVRPSQLLTYSPVVSTANGGKTWTPAAPAPGLAAVPDALAAAPGRGQLMALTRSGRVEQGRSSWTTLISLRGMSAARPARACAPTGLTAVAYGLSGQPVVAARCGHRGVVGILADQGGRWSVSGPTLPGRLDGRQVEVVRLVRTGSRLTALLRVGSGAGARLVAGWQDADGRWMLSAALPDAGAVLSSSLGADGAVVVELGGRRAELVAGPGSGAGWQALPRLPQGRAVTLALTASGGVDALAADVTVLTAWRLEGGRWAQTQTTKVPLQYGSSS